jgi:DNA-binding transcriptional regulator GbsR (MarR family)
MIQTLSDFSLEQAASYEFSSYKEEKQFEQKHFIEEVGLLFEMAGMPRMAGRVFGWLLISNPPHQSPGELADVLQASKGSISTMTRLLVQIGLIERLGVPGQRRDYFRIKLNAWSELTNRRTAQITAFRQLAEQGLHLLDGSEPQLRLRLEEMRDMHAFLEQEIPLMTDRWEKQRSKPRLESVHPTINPQPVSDRGLIR